MATSRGFGEFSRRMEFRADELGDNVDKLIRKIGIVADQAIVFATPVDKGVARSNWVVSLDRAFEGTIPAYAPGEGLGVGEAANAQAAIQQALAVIASRRPGQSIVIANNLPYIEPLNQGSSRQAPAGFVGIGVRQAAVAVAGTRVLPSA